MTIILNINKPAGFLAELLFRFNSNSIDSERRCKYNNSNMNNK